MQLGAVGLDAWQRAVVLPDDARPRLAQLVAHQRQAALDGLVHVDDARRAVGVRLALHRLYELADPRRAAADVVEQLADHRQARKPCHGVSNDARAAAARERRELVGSDAAIDERRRYLRR